MEKQSNFETHTHTSDCTLCDALLNQIKQNFGSVDKEEKVLGADIHVAYSENL